MAMPAFRLRELPLALRLALGLLVLVTLGGYLASGAHLREHHENRDEREGLSMTDLVGAYHGVTSRASLLEAIEDDHPGELAGHEALEDSQRELLLGWLRSERISDDYDNLDLGDDAPAEVLAVACMECHSSSAPEQLRAEPPLDYWDDVRKVAFSRAIAPTDAKILLASTHAHAIALATITLLVCALALFTRFPSALKHALVLGASAGLAVDLAAWWLARGSAAMAYLIVVGGVVHAGCMAFMMLAILVELFAPNQAEPG